MKTLRLPAAPIAIQILALVIGALVVAQLVTLALTLILPPAPPQQHSLAEIAQALRGGPLEARSSRPLTRSLERAPPALNSAGWVVSQRTTADLAGLLKVPQSEVRILFYAPPPLAGTAGPPPAGPPPNGPPRAALSAPPRMILAGYALAGPGGDGGGMAPPPGGMMGPPPGGMMGPGDMTTGPIGPGPTDPSRMGRWPDRAPSDMRRPRGTTERRPAPMDRTSTRPEGSRPPMDGPRSSAGPGAPPRAEGPRPPARIVPRTPLESAVFAPRAVDLSLVPQPVEPKRQATAPVKDSAPRTPTTIILASPTPAPAEAPVVETPQPAAPAAAAPAPATVVAERPLPRPAAPSVFSLGRAPYVEGEFVAALHTQQGWVTVKPQPEGFPNSWQRRVLIWFGLSFGLVAPLGYVLARRLAAPLGRFAAAAERLGREPAADLAPLAGPAEVGRAARAFNLMQQRLKRYVEDRTGMVGAISHDLRTPLARMRFKLERAPPALRAALGRDIAQMEEMITSVLSFMRDETVGAQRDSIDLRSLLECVVDEAGEGAELASGPPVAVTVDVLGMQRVFENLVDNALKYGTAARVSLGVQDGEAVVEVADDGPGLTAEDLEQVFKPFYRSQEAKASGKAGMGLGLAVSRSTVRAHGGELTLKPGAQGLIARVRLPTAAAVAIAA
jgi:two-component system OmpR family sensor kinase